MKQHDTPDLLRHFMLFLCSSVMLDVMRTFNVVFLWGGKNNTCHKSRRRNTSTQKFCIYIVFQGTCKITKEMSALTHPASEVFGLCTPPKDADNCCKCEGGAAFQAVVAVVFEERATSTGE